MRSKRLIHSSTATISSPGPPVLEPPCCEGSTCAPGSLKRLRLRQLGRPRHILQRAAQGKLAALEARRHCEGRAGERKGKLHLAYLGALRLRRRAGNSKRQHAAFQRGRDNGTLRQAVQHSNGCAADGDGVVFKLNLCLPAG